MKLKQTWGWPHGMKETEGVEVAIVVESRLDGEGTVSDYRGTLFRKPKAIYLRYIETGEDDEHSAVTLRYDGQELKIRRHGYVDGEQSFVNGKRRPGSYTVQGAQLRLETETELLQMAGGPEGALPITLDWQYGLWIEEEWTGRFQLRLSIEEVKQG